MQIYIYSRNITRPIMKSYSKYPRLRQLKLEQAIVDGNYKIICHSDKSRIYSKELEIVLDGETSGIRIDEFLLNNDWNRTIVAVSGKRPENNSYSEISYEEQEAVTTYVKDSLHYTMLKSYFQHHFNNPLFLVYSPTPLSANARQEILQNKIDTVRENLKLLVCMQSAFNKARIKYPHSSEEVYRDIAARGIAYEIAKPKDKRFEKHEEANTAFVEGNTVVQMISVASTARRKSETPSEPPRAYAGRDTRFVILKGSDAIPLRYLIDEAKYPELWEYVKVDERENFLGIRPAFFVRKDFTKVDIKADIAFQYTLRHITQADQSKIEKLQRLYRIRNQFKKVMPRNRHLDFLPDSDNEIARKIASDEALWKNIESHIMTRIDSIKQLESQFGRETISLLSRIPSAAKDIDEVKTDLINSKMLVRSQVDFLENEYLNELKKLSDYKKPYSLSKFLKKQNTELVDPSELLNHFKDGNATQHHYLRILGLLLREIYQAYPLLAAKKPELVAVRNLAFPKNYQSVFASVKKSPVQVKIAIK